MASSLKPFCVYLKPLVIAFSLLAMESVTVAQQASFTIQNLTCEQKKNPVGIDTQHPRFGWNLNSNARGARQTAYQVLVATKPELLTPDGADLWNSQQVQATSNIQVQYAGKPLTTNQKLYWMVRTWDEAGRASMWSEPAEFTMGVLHKADWSGKWIGSPAESPEESPIASSHWIWSSAEMDAKDEGTTDGKPAAGAVRYFKKSFTVPAEAKAAKLDIIADNESEIYLNGTKVTSTSDWKAPVSKDASGAIQPGKENILTVRVKNTGSSANSAGVIAALMVKDGPTIYTDDSWQVSRAAEGAGWPEELLKESKDQPEWKPAVVLGKWGMQPWNKISTGVHPVLPILRKDVNLDKKIRRASINISGLGHYVLHINGKKVGDHFLDVPWSVYDKTVYYNTFDVTDNLTTGPNALGVMLGKGFYNTLGDRRIHGVMRQDPLKVIAELNIEYCDGTTATVSSDESWKWKAGPLTHNAILGGTDYDARLLPDGWDKAGFDSSEWKNVSVLEPPKGVLKAANAPPMRAKEEFAPKSIEQPEPGHFVYDFGQNCSATPKLSVQGTSGSVITLVWAEQRKGQDPFTNNGKGVVDQSGIGSGHITYTLKGGDVENWFSELFYTGYQYLEVTGAVPEGEANPRNLPVIKSLKSVHVRSDQPEVGTFQTSNEMYNRIDKMIDWAVRSNLGHVFTDCPTREKLGWLEVPWLMWASVASRYDIQNYAEKISSDIHDSQLPDGQILTVAPSYPEFGGGFKYTAEWGAAGVFLPWYNYEWYGDVRSLETNYDMMKGFVDYLESTSDKLIAAPGLGDWYDYWPGQKLGASQFTPTELTATTVFAGCADIVSSSAAILKKPEEHAKYAKLAGEIRKAFNKKFRTGPGQYQNSGSPQTGHAMALVFDMVPKDERTSCALAIVDDLKTREWQQTSGDVGYRFLINALSQSGHSDVIFKILNRDKIGSYAYLVNAGWTSLPEAWNASPTSSMNHCMLGHIQEWFTQHLLGIAPAANVPGFETILIQPTPGEGVDSASGSLDSPRGKITLKWEKKDNKLQVDFIIPANTTGLVRLPVSATAKILESGHEIAADNAQIKRLGRDGDREVIRVESGTYSFTAES